MDQNQALVNLIHKYLEDSKDALDVARYLVTHVGVLRQASAGVAIAAETIPMLPPAIMSVLRYQTGLTSNPFYNQWSHLINAALALEDVTTANLNTALQIYSEKENPIHAQIVKELTPQRYGSLVLIVLLAKGHQAAIDFGFELRPIIATTETERGYFERYGV